MIVSKSQLESFYLALAGTEGILSLSESRIRDPFLKSLKEEIELFEQDRKKIYKTFADNVETSENGETVYHFPKDKVPEVEKELTALLDEEVDLDAPERLKEILEKTDYKPKAGETELIDEILAKL